MTDPGTDAGKPDPGLLDRLRWLGDGVLGEAPASAVVRALPDVVRAAGGVWWRTNRWTIETGARFGGMVVRGAISGRPPQTIVDEVVREARQVARDLLGVADADPMPESLRRRVPARPDGNGEISLPDRLAALLDASADLTYTHHPHPAYLRLLSELAPDEARILRLFAHAGPQPAVDVRTRRPFGVGSTLVKQGITMIGRYAGCQDVERVPAYLNNLFRLGLIWFSREALPEQSVYDVLEAQEEVEEALALAGRGVTVRRSIELTAFGRNLCAQTGLLPQGESIAPAGDEDSGAALPPPDAR
ncbi:Abi-alpha family protein [Pseudonocardia sp.]|uniref:Abi-alpha family protein n=1 Tax=Pseudonocardia sp. TaxID=60912 RepID=UPI003D0F8D62